MTKKTKIALGIIAGLVAVMGIKKHRNNMLPADW